MDVSALLLPGTQNLLSEMLKETWSAARSLVARVWARGNDEDARAMEGELEQVRAEVLELRGHQGPFSESADGLPVAYCAGYLRNMVLDRPDLLTALQSLPSAIVAARDNVTITGGAAQIINGATGTALSIQHNTGNINLTNNA